jgi:NAD(P)-dependent dehydrogenase (short-subunit alcohol dehydrogenase family)
MEQRVAIVTGGLRGLGRAMAVGLARRGHNVVAVGHIDADIAAIEEETSGINPDGRILPLVADLRQPADCDRVVAMTLSRFGGMHILVNNAGLTFTTIDPARFRRAEPQKFWQVSDDIVRAVIDTNYIAAEPDGTPRRAQDDRAALWPDRQCDDQARHDEPPAHLALRRLEGGA